MFRGSPAHASIDGLKFVDGLAETSSGAVNRGGAIYLTGGSASLYNVVFEKNTAMRGGAIYADSGVLLSIDGSYFVENIASRVSSSLF